LVGKEGGIVGRGAGGNTDDDTGKDNQAGGSDNAEDDDERLPLVDNACIDKDGVGRGKDWKNDDDKDELPL
jgi:hypothetical protein